MEELDSLICKSVVRIWSRYHLSLNRSLSFWLVGARHICSEIHYDNPQGISGIDDSSGIRVYYTRRPRKHDMAVLQIGDPYLQIVRKNRFVGNGVVEHTFECPSSCSSLALNEPVTIFAETLHMHKKGIYMRNEVVRQGEVVHSGHVDFFNFEQQAGYVVPQEPYRFLPGDEFRTYCTYNSQPGLEFGLASEEEM